MFAATRNNKNTFGNFIISCEAPGFIPPFVLRDEPADRYQINLSDYFSITYEKFSTRLKKFKDFSNIPNVAEEKELISLLETLINTKEMIRAKEEFDGENGREKK
ncbi:MAG: hypothetical protein ABSE68_01095 [Minisyncoccia bacterium]